MSSGYLLSSFITILALIFLLGFAIGRRSKKQKAKKTYSKQPTYREKYGPLGSDPYNKRNGYSSSNNGLSHGVSSYSTPAQDALIDQMKAEGLLSEFEKDLLISNRSFCFASSIIDEHMEEHKRIVAARKREEEEKAKNKKTWLDLDELEGNAFWYPVEQKKYLFTRREVEFYRLLKKSCSKKGFSVCPKVRIADIFNVTSDDKEEKALWFRTIAQLHVDFLVLDKYDKMYFAIELDDASHNTEKAKRKDWFKDQLFRCDPVLLVRIDEIPDEAKMDVLVDRCAEVANERREHYAKLFDKWKSFF